MSSSQVEVHGTLRADGTVQLSEPVDLPPGEVRVILRTLDEPIPSPDRFWSMMNEIWAGQRARGHRPRSRQEIDDQIAALRREAEEELGAIERIHNERRQSTSGDEGYTEGGR